VTAKYESAHGRNEKKKLSDQSCWSLWSLQRDINYYGVSLINPNNLQFLQEEIFLFILNHSTPKNLETIVLLNQDFHP